jgi:TM2 domain-containing membrane protein YozV
LPATWGKDWFITMILCAAGGVWGLHRFYTGHLIMGLLELMTFGGCGLLIIYDMVLIVTGKFKDSQGRPLVRNIAQ